MINPLQPRNQESTVSRCEGPVSLAFSLSIYRAVPTGQDNGNNKTHLIFTFRFGIPNLNHSIRAETQKHHWQTDFRIAFRKDKNLRDLLVRAKLPPVGVRRHPNYSEPKLQQKPTTTSSLHKQIYNLEDKRRCLRCVSLEYTSKFIMSKGCRKITNREIIHCHQKHNQYVIRCFLCNTWDQHKEFITPHNLIENFRKHGYSLNKEEHSHDRRPADIQIFPVWSVNYITIGCNKCNFKKMGKIDRMPETIEEEITAATNSLKSAIFGTQTTVEGRKCNKCQACKKNGNQTIITSKQNFNAKIQKFNCKEEGIIYAIKCNTCSQLYIGQSGRNLTTRIGEHIRDITKQKSNSSVAAHFNKHAYAKLNFECQILEYEKDKFTRLIKEGIWIDLLKTTFPEGLNAPCEGHYKVSNISISNYRHFQHDKSCRPTINTTLA